MRGVKEHLNEQHGHPGLFDKTAPPSVRAAQMSHQHVRLHRLGSYVKHPHDHVKGSARGR